MSVTLTNITKRFGSVVAVDDFSIDVQEGELLSVVGPSGCGKTTLLRIVAGLTPPDEGRVVIGGRDVTHDAPERRGIGLVFQQYALFPNMNVADNIVYGLKRQKVPRAQRQARLKQLMTMIGLDGLEKRRVHQLSAGQQQRVALARALAPEPDMLLLDEPFSALDAAIRQRLRDDLRRMQRALGTTMVLVTHDQEEALAIADRVAVMDRGRLEQLDPPWTLYDTPKTPFVASFIGRGNRLIGTAYTPVGATKDHAVTAEVTTEVTANATAHVTAQAAPEDDSPGTVPARAPSEAGWHLQGLGWIPGHVTRPGPGIALIRPEHVVVTKLTSLPGESDQDHTRLTSKSDESSGWHGSGVVRDVYFGGERAMISLEVATTDGSSVSFVASVEGEKGRALAEKVGASVHIFIPADRVRWMPMSHTDDNVTVTAFPQ